MTIRATTPNPAEVAKHFSDYADILEIYASDQRAALRMYSTKREKNEALTRAAVYDSIAEEMRAIEFIQGELDK